MIDGGAIWAVFIAPEAPAGAGMDDVELMGESVVAEFARGDDVSFSAVFGAFFSVSAFCAD